jgi:hypothetical protein
VSRVRARFTTTVVVAASLLLLPAGAASATIRGSCTAALNDTPVTTGHDTAGSAVHVDYRGTAQYTGEATSGQTVGAARVSLEIEGFGIRRHQASIDGPRWADTVDVKKYAWAGIGLYQVTSSARDEGGAPICTGSALICVDGKPFLFTVAGAVAALAGLVAIFLVIRGLMVRRRRSRLRIASRFGGAGFLGGVAVPVLLQQSCTLPLTKTVALAATGGGLLVMVVVGLLVGGRHRRAGQPIPGPAAAPPPPPARQRHQDSVYRFVPGESACAACRSHAEHRTYRTAEAAAADRAHEGCECAIAPEATKDPFLVERFAGRDVLDDRDG